MNPIFATLVLGGVSALDATPVAQTLLFQPLVTATLLGLAWGDMALALQVGVVLQVLAASTLPIGARTPEDYASGGVIGAGLALALGAGTTFPMAREASVLVGVMAGLVASIVGVPITKWQRRLNEGLARWAEAEVRGGREAALGHAQLAAIALAFAVGLSYTAVCLGAGTWGLAGAVRNESLRLAHAWSLAEPLWLGLGLAQLLHAFVQRRLARAAVFGGALMTAWLVQMLGAP
jgi:mannose/fructose/N-acetylgalactosamine-specific phosphotransferase system component IIC